MCGRNFTDRLRDDLTKHFSDVFVPMAHSIHEAPVSAYCSSWALEYAMLHALEQALDTDHPELTTQRERVATWRLRCKAQIEQLGICILRDVYSLEPAHRDNDPTNLGCEFKLSEDAQTACESNGSPFYITDNCLVMCQGQFYDPCRCHEDSCDTAVFNPDSCASGILLDVRPYGSAEDVQLHSLHWPTEVNEDEGGPLDTTRPPLNLESV